MSLVTTFSDDYKYDSWDTAQAVAHQLNHETRDIIGHYDVQLTDEEVKRTEKVLGNAYRTINFLQKEKV